MIAGADAVKTRVLQEINRRADEYVEVCCRLVRFNTENPPGNNTTQIADLSVVLPVGALPDDAWMVGRRLHVPLRVEGA